MRSFLSRSWFIVVGIAAACSRSTTPAAAPAPALSGGAASSPTPADPASPATPPERSPDPAAESLGPLRLGMPATEVEQALGSPTEKGARVEEPATGDIVQSWRYAKLGIVVTMRDAGGHQEVARISAEAPAPVVTERGIGIGSSRAELEEAYRDVRDEEMSGPDVFVAGSVYGGIVFHIEDDKVSSIFLGASAE